MVETASIALSGLMAVSQRLAASASNIANMSTVGALPTSAAPVSTVYKPLSVSYTALVAGNAPGGVRAQVTEDPDGYTATYDPSSVFADSEGLIAVPNVSLEREAINIMEARSVYKANVSVLKAEREMLEALLNSVK